MGILDRLTKKKDPGLRFGAKSFLAQKSPASASVKAEKEKIDKPVEAAAKDQEPKKISVVSKETMAASVLIRPVLSEKTVHAEAHNVYTFFVQPDASKYTVMKAVQDVYGVKPTHIRMINTQGKWVRMAKGYGKRKDVKKALVTLRKGTTIQVHDGV